VIHEPGFLDNVTEMGARLRQSLEQMIPNHDHLFQEVRGHGLMLGLKLKSDARRFVGFLRDEHQLLTVAAGDNVIRLVPPLVIDETHIAECVDKLSAAARVYVPETDD
jgi:acetylornithine/N-succinyldiaminopimelate aminotransferase